MGVISLGDWREGSEPNQRVAFPFRMRTNHSYYQIALLDKEDSPWSDVEFSGQMLDRVDALKHEWKDEVFHLSNHIGDEDKEVQESFQ